MITTRAPDGANKNGGMRRVASKVWGLGHANLATLHAGSLYHHLGLFWKVTEEMEGWEC